MNKFYHILYSLFFTAGLSAQPQYSIFINEFMASNASVHADIVDYDDFTDWIELYNDEDVAVDISGYFITDDQGDPQKWQFPAGTILPPKGFLRIWADGYNDIPGQNRTRPWVDANNEIIRFKTDYCHLNFSLSRAGEYIGLCEENGTLVDSIRYNLQYRDVSYGRQPDGSNTWYFFGEPTPGSSNITDGVSNPLFSDSPLITPESGFYSGPLSVSMDATDPGDTIFYSLDGSRPGTHSETYLTPFSLNETTMLSARLFEEGKLPGTISYRSLFNSENFVLPVISITTPAKFLWDELIGIYSNRMKSREIPVSFEFFSTPGQPELSMNAGLRLTGQASLYYPQISFTLNARDRYGPDEFSYPFFPGRKLRSFKSIYLRNGGFPDHRDTYIRDAVQAGLVMNKIDLDVQAYLPTVVYLNGQYWGIYNLREKIGTKYLASLHNINPDDIDLLEYENGNSTPVVLDGNADNYSSFFQYIESNDLSLEESFHRLENWLDIEAFINYQICNIYYDNVFWQAENVRMWRERQPHGKWRWILFDNDWSFGLQPNPRSDGYTNNTLKFATSASSSPFNPPEWSTLIFTKLLQNQRFKEQFIQHFDVYLNSIFHKDTVIATINSYQQGIAPEMNRHITRWKDGDNYFTPPLPDYGTWLDKVEVMREFARNRPEHQRQHILDYFGLSGTTILQISILNPESGKVKINDAISFDRDVSGEWFRDVPVELFAIPEPGYQFSGWEGDANDTLNKITINLDHDTVRLTARFEAIDISLLSDTISEDTTLTLSGSPWYASGDLVVNPNVTLTLEEGVTLLMPDEACILVYGQLIVNGTDQNLVRISPNDFAESWGALCFINATDSSVIRNLVIRGATKGHDFERDKAAISSYNSDLSLEYVSVFDSEEPIYIQYGQTMIQGCMLQSTTSGDLINVKKAESIHVENCDLLGGNYFDSDAIDYDQLTEGVIKGNLIRNFYGYNSDAIDLGEDSHDILIEDNVIANIADKGISIGNGSDGIIRRNLIANCGQGIGVKDENSYGYSSQNTFYGNQYGVASFVKNTGQGGGNLDVVNSIFANSRTSPVLVDELSVARVSYSLSNTKILDGMHNLKDDPLFLNDLRLAQGSPAINAGNPTLPNDPDGSVADLGAFPFEAEKQGSLIINEIHYHPSEGDQYQFVEILNAGSSAVNLKDYLLWGNVRFLFPDVSINPGEFILVTKDQASYAGQENSVYQWDSGDLESFPGRIHLTDNQGFTVDNVDYDNQFWWPLKPDGQGPSLELHSPDLENMVSTSWRSSFNEGGTPGRSNNSEQIDGIFINEFMASNRETYADEFKENDDWIEFYNSNDYAVNLGGMYITDNLDFPLKHQISMHHSDSTTIPAKGFLLFWADGQPEQGIFHLSFVLDRQGEQIGLAHLHEEDIRFIDSLSYTLQKTDTSQGRYPDGADRWHTCDVATPLRPNQIPLQLDDRLQPVNMTRMKNYPNPFIGSTVINFRLEETGMAEVTVYDCTGRKVTTLLREQSSPGIFELEWNARDCKPGIYYCKLKTEWGYDIQKMVLLSK